MRLRIRGPAGQSTVNLDDLSTVENLRDTIATQTSLEHFDVKYGYPPKSLLLDQYSRDSLLSQINVKLDGEQLTVSKIEPPTKPTTSLTKAIEDLTPKHTQTSTRRKSDKSAPLSLSRKANAEMSEPPEVFLPELGGSLVLRIMPDDNSCLFRAVASAIMSNLDALTELRSIIAETIQANREKYTKAILDNKDPDEYCRWIRNEDAWGGQIELDILSQHFAIEICSIDVQTLRVDRYNENASRRCIVVYSGIHYDTIALSIFGLTPEDDVKQFESPLSDEILPEAVKLCQKLQEKHYYTDTAAFQVKCGDCGTICIGETGATQHAQQTGHYNFGEAA